jgi:hypothetical protein
MSWIQDTLPDMDGENFLASVQKYMLALVATAPDLSGDQRDELGQIFSTVATLCGLERLHDDCRDRERDAWERGWTAGYAQLEERVCQ